jgi:hypothetical protein
MTNQEIHNAVDNFIRGFEDPLVVALEVEEVMSVLRGRIDHNLGAQILQLNADYRKKLVEGLASNRIPVYPSGVILQALHKFSLSLPPDQRSNFITSVSGVWAAVENNLYSKEARLLAAMQQIIEKYLEVETLFDNSSFTDVVSQLRKTTNSDYDKILGLCRSHINLDAKNTLLVRLMEEMRGLPLAGNQRPKVPAGVPLRYEINTRNLKLRLRDLAKLHMQSYIHVSFTANLVLMNQNIMRPETRRQRLHDTITSALTTGENVGESDRVAILKKFVDSNIVIRDLLIESLRNDTEYQIAAMELYLMKLYQTNHVLKDLSCGYHLSEDMSDMSPWIKFSFRTHDVGSIAGFVEEAESPDGSKILSHRYQIINFYWSSL